ncbi:flippase-like domain-containing protein [bacterium]|nr:flippase-like domain-containing protein [bacterium]
MALKKNLKIAISFIIVAVLFFLLFRKLDFELFRKYLSEGNKLLILCGVLVYLSSFAVRALRWKVLLRHIGNFKVPELAPVIVAGYAVNNVLPVRIGEIVRAAIAGKIFKISIPSAFASVFVERVFDGLTIALILSATLFFYPFQDNMKIIALVASLLFAILFVFALAAAFSSKPLEFVVFLRRKSPKILSVFFDFSEKFLKGAASLDSWKKIVATFVLSMCVWAFELAVYLLISAAFGVKIPFVGCLVMLCAANLGMLAAPTPAGLGVFQGAIVFALESFNVPYEQRMAVAVILHAAQIVPTTIIGFIWIWVKNLRVDAPPQNLS